MKVIIKIAYLSLIIASVVNAGGEAGLAYLKIPVDARASAMGGAYTSLVNNAFATYWNPAGLALAEKNSVVLMHNSWFQDVNHEFAAVHLFQGQHNIALSLNMISISGIQLRGNRASAEPDGETSAQNVSLSLGYATKLDCNWNVGVQLKYLYEKYYLVSAEGFAFDIGVTRKDIIPDLSIGLTIQNIGKMSKLKNESTPLPLLFRTGISYILPWQILNNRPVIASDLVIVKDNVSYLCLGSEIGIIQNLDLRFGYIFGNESYSFTTGFGIKYSSFDLSYAFVPFQYNFGISHRFSFVIDY